VAVTRGSRCCNLPAQKRVSRQYSALGVRAGHVERHQPSSSLAITSCHGPCQRRNLRSRPAHSLCRIRQRAEHRAVNERSPYGVEHVRVVGSHCAGPRNRLPNWLVAPDDDTFGQRQRERERERERLASAWLSRWCSETLIPNGICLRRVACYPLCCGACGGLPRLTERSR
jgi:hypothetical protein